MRRNALKLIYGHVGFKKFSRGETPKPPVKRWPCLTHKKAKLDSLPHILGHGIYLFIVTNLAMLMLLNIYYEKG